MIRPLTTLYLALTTALMLNGCAVYTVASAGSYITTGKSIGDNGSSLVTANDCNSVKYAVGSQDYYCERAREPGTTYNRSAF